MEEKTSCKNILFLKKIREISDTIFRVVYGYREGGANDFGAG